jgi:hypothetical protein
VHHYRRPEPRADVELPAIEELRFNDAVDVVAWAEIDFMIGHQTWPEVWHLDDDGHWWSMQELTSGRSAWT